jgi:RimJ/RimL family protein N-acetyltransferase
MTSAGDIPGLRTARLLLRPWRDEDLDAWTVLNADPRVMEQMGGPREPAQSAAAMQRIRAHFDRHGFGVWAVELPGAARFIGFVGLAVPEFQAHFTPCVEVGWRLAYAHWGKGYATEGARAALDHGFARLGLSQIVSFTAASNARSRDRKSVV